MPSAATASESSRLPLCFHTLAVSPTELNGRRLLPPAHTVVNPVLLRTTSTGSVKLNTLEDATSGDSTRMPYSTLRPTALLYGDKFSGFAAFSELSSGHSSGKIRNLTYYCNHARITQQTDAIQSGQYSAADSDRFGVRERGFTFSSQ